MTVYLSIDELIQINLEMVEVFGGALGVRDRGALEAAAARPQTGYYRDIIEEGAALCESLLRTTLSSMETRELRLRQQPFSMK